MSDPKIRPETLFERLAKYRVLVADADFDIIFKSSDNVHFKVHRINLQVASQGFSAPDNTLESSLEEVVDLQENSDVLNLLFQYMYPQRQPDLKIIKFSLLLKLAEAAEKYQVFSAMQSCNLLMQCV